jgi:hypothetical protein
MQKAKLALAICLTTSLIALPIANSATGVKPGASCPIQEENRNYKGKMYTCIKVGKKWVWDKGVTISSAPKPSPSPTSRDIFSPIAVTTLKGSTVSGRHTFSFVIPSANPAVSQYELGYMLLKKEGLDPSFDLDYSQPSIYKVLTNDSFVVSNEEIMQIFKSRGLDSSKLSIMFKVRTNWNGAVSTWGNGVYLTPNQYLTQIPTPSPSPSPVILPDPVTNLSGSLDFEKLSFSFDKPKIDGELKYFEIGLSYLLDPASDPTKTSNYSTPKVLRNIASEKFSVSIDEYLSFLLFEAKDSRSGAALTKVRVVTSKGTSAWSSGVYTTAVDLRAALSTYVPPSGGGSSSGGSSSGGSSSGGSSSGGSSSGGSSSGGSSSGGSSSGGSSSTPAPAPTASKVLKYFTITATRDANCTSRDVSSKLTSARLIVPSSGGGTGSAKYVYKPGSLSQGSHGASVSAGVREYWTKATFQSPFVYQSSSTWYADVEITCSYLG